MTVHTRIPRIESILERFSVELGRDRVACTNHVLRVANFFAALGGVDACPDQVLIAAAFHDLGIWTAGTFDYLEPSVQVARAHSTAHASPISGTRSRPSSSSTIASGHIAGRSSRPSSCFAGQTSSTSRSG